MPAPLLPRAYSHAKRHEKAIGLNETLDVCGKILVTGIERQTVGARSRVDRKNRIKPTRMGAPWPS
ncbi:hypothetical protein RvVAR031_34880 [Agrobacterium vitis]|nr:hypothetical protein RvVAR031_34880 [Agrobacterium vitis]